MDETRLSKFITENHNLIYSFLSRYGFSVDEYYGAAAEGLCKAAKKFDENRGFKFSTYAYYVMLNQVRQEMRRNKNRLTTVSYEELLYNGIENMTIESNLIGDKDMENNISSIIDIENKLYYLSNLELEVIASRIAGKTQKEIGKEVKKSQSYITRIAKSTVDFLLSDNHMINSKRFGYHSMKEMSTEQINKRKYLINQIDTYLRDGKNVLEINNRKRVKDTKQIKKLEKSQIINRSTNTNKKIVVYPGSFDPITLGHLDIIERASKLFDEVIVAIGKNSSKKYTFSLTERIDMINKTCKHISNVKADSFKGLIAKYIKDTGAIGVVKGLRAISDFDYEFQMSLTNKSINNEFETILLPSNLDYMYLSSSMVREIGRLGGDISKYISSSIHSMVSNKLSTHSNNE